MTLAGKQQKVSPDSQTPKPLLSKSTFEATGYEMFEMLSQMLGVNLFKTYRETRRN